MNQKVLELVVATHGESLEWLMYLPDPMHRPYSVTISCSMEGRKKDPLADHWVERENAGREAGHWLQHIVTRHGSLAEWTVFLQAEPFAHAGSNLHGPAGLFRLLWDKGWSGLPVPWASVGQKDFQVPSWPHQLFPNRERVLLAGWGDLGLPNVGTPFLIGAQFIVHRDLVHARPRDHYERILALAPLREFSLAHELEPVWRLVFAEKPISEFDSVWKKIFAKGP